MRTFLLLPVTLVLCACASVKEVSDSDFVNGIRDSPWRPFYSKVPDPSDPSEGYEYYGIKFEQVF
jgi:hypothetical protein